MDLLHVGPSLEADPRMRGDETVPPGRAGALCPHADEVGRSHDPAVGGRWGLRGLQSGKQLAVALVVGSGRYQEAVKHAMGPPLARSRAVAQFGRDGQSHRTKPVGFKKTGWEEMGFGRGSKCREARALCRTGLTRWQSWCPWRVMRMSSSASLCTFGGRPQAVNATAPPSSQPESSNPSVWRGRPFSSAAISSSSTWLRAARSLPFGRYWRSSPLVFSFEPRCQGEWGSQK